MSHKPTFHPAIAKASSSSGFKTTQTSVKDQNTHTVLKYRKTGQHSQEEMKQANLRAELHRREVALHDEKRMAIAMVEKEEKSVAVPLLLTDAVSSNITNEFDDRDADFGESDDSDSDDSENDDDDDEEELQRELEKIKAERQAAQFKKEEEERQLAEQSHKESALRGNPLLKGLTDDSSAKVKRKWNDDVVFRNQAVTEPEVKKRFVNDTIRNDFHRSFLKKYIC